MQAHLKKYITIYNPVYTALTSAATSGAILLANDTIATTFIVVIAVGVHALINKGKDKLSELDETSLAGKFKKENSELKDKLSEKDAMLIAIRAELINYAAKDNAKKTKKESEQFLKGLLTWCAESEGMNKMSDVKHEDKNTQRETMRKFLENAN